MVTAEKIYKFISDGYPGGTFTANGDVATDEQGYYVGIGGLYLYYSDERDFVVNNLAGLIASHPEAEYFGFWRDENGICVDVVKHYDNAAEAIDAGRHYQQVAIWDIVAGREIFL